MFPKMIFYRVIISQYHHRRVLRRDFLTLRQIRDSRVLSFAGLGSGLCEDDKASIEDFWASKKPPIFISVTSIHYFID